MNFQLCMDNVISRAIFLLLVLAILYNVFLRNINLPPGPVGLPVLGYLPFLGKKAFLTIHALTLKFGPIFCFYLGQSRVVVLGSYEAVKEALSNPKILDRPPHPPNHLLPESSSLSVTNGIDWKVQRQFSMQLLRKLGMGKSNMEKTIQKEIQYLMDEISIKKGKPLNLDEVLLSSVSNNIYYLLTGQRLDYEDDDKKFLNDVLKTMTMYFRPTIVHAYFPKLKWWLQTFGIWGYDKVNTLMTKFGKFAELKMKEHSNSLDDVNVKNYISGYLQKMSKTIYDSSTFSEKMLKGNFLSIFGAGSTPARATVEWALVCMVYRPDIQKKVRQEIHSVLGREKTPCWTDRHQLPYVTAVTMEVMRSNTTIPISMLRCASEDTKIRGYDIPKGTIVMTNLWSVHHNPDEWTKPMEFHPERFLRDGKIIKPQAFIPFSYGKRNCPGEDLANTIIFLYFTSIMQRYTIVQPSTQQSFPELLGIANLVVLNNVCLIEDTN